MKRKLTAMLMLIASSALADPSPTPPALNSALADMVTKATQTAGSDKDFLVSQTPDVIRQLLYWKAAESLVSDLLAIIIIIACVLYIRKFTPLVTHHWDETDSMFIAMGGGASLLGAGAVAIIALLSLNLVWLEVWLAPKVYLLEYAKTLIHS